MKKQKNIGLYLDRQVTQQDLDMVNKFFPNYDDFVVFSTIPRVIDDPKIATLPDFYLYFFNGIVIFDNEIAMKNYSKKISSTDIFLLANNNIISVDKDILNNELR